MAMPLNCILRAGIQLVDVVTARERPGRSCPRAEVMRGMWPALAFTAWQAACTASGAEAFHRLAGPEITARFGGMELSDEVHWGLTFGRNGKLISVENDSVNKDTGTWQVIGNKLCLAFGQDQPRCHEVWILGRGVRLMREGEPSLDGVLQKSRYGKGAVP